MSGKLRIVVVALALVAGMQWWSGHHGTGPDSAGAAAPSVASAHYPDFLPPEAAATLEAIRRPEGIVIGWTLNELDDAKRALVAERLAHWVAKGSRLLVIEPVSKRVTPWWDEWVQKLPSAHCSVFEKRLRLDLPPKIALLARSAGLGAEGTVVRVLAARG